MSDPSIDNDLATKLDALIHNLETDLSVVGTCMIRHYNGAEGRPCTADEHPQFALVSCLGQVRELVKEYPQLRARPDCGGNPVAALELLYDWALAAKRAIGALPAGGPSKGAKATHSPDFRSALWFGKSFEFTPTQALMVAVLWKAWEGGTPTIGEAHLIEAAIDDPNDSTRVASIFRKGAGAKAFGTMIQPGETKGSFKLVPPVCTAE